MKKWIGFLAISAMVLLNCQKNEVAKSADKFSNDELERLVLLDTSYALSKSSASKVALDVAAKFLDKADGINRKISRIITIPSLFKLTGQTLIKSSFAISKPETPSLYAINFNDNDGYIILSADRRAPGVFAMVGKGKLDSTAHVGLSIFLENAIKHVDERVARTESFRGDASYNNMVSKLDILNSQSTKIHDGARVANRPCTSFTTTDVISSYNFMNYVAQPILKTLWDQGHPYNLGQPDGGCYTAGFCGANPRYKAGCVAVAEGQVVAYFYGKGNVGDWRTIAGTKTACYLTGLQTNAVSNLLHNIYLDYGIYVKRDCGNTQASIEISDISVTDPRGICPTYGLVQGKWRGWNTGDIRNSLLNGSPVVITGQINLCCVLVCWGCGRGHEWVIDGMRDLGLTMTYQVTTTYSGGSTTCPPTSVFTYTTTQTALTQIHQNWGWGPNTGSESSDWYAQDVFQSNVPQGTKDINFNHANYIVPYITPR